MSAALIFVTSQFEGHELTTYVFRGRVCVIAAQVGKILDYADDGKKLVDVIRDKWGDEFIAGHDFEVLEGDALRGFKAAAGDTLPGWVSSTARLMVLYESGFDLVFTKTEKPAGRRLRRLLVDEVIPRLRRGEPVLPKAQPAPSTLVDDQESQIRLLALRQREALSIYVAIPGLYAPEYLRHKVEHAAALVTGERPAIENPLLDVSGYLRARGLTAAELKSKGPTFGKRVKALYTAERGEAPKRLPRDINGSSREVFSYTERDRRLFDQAFAEMFGAPAALPTDPAPTPANDAPEKEGPTAA
ncbi:hypothetical protein WME98_50125 [Sorangium sp. So ce296]|uniref:hypothetical protein n=1 Tax=Sorangium sp. So ce296 TaxID=3133296 RepID=UPI003F62466C